MRERIRYLMSAATVVGVSITLASCSSESKSTPAPGDQVALGTINDHCPVLGFKKVNPEAPVVEYKSHRIGFCCDKCPKTWAEWSDEKKDAFVARQLD